MPKSRFPFIEQLTSNTDPTAWGYLRQGLDIWWAQDAADYALTHDASGNPVQAVTANNALHLNGKDEAALSVLFATQANNAQRLTGKLEGDLNVNSAFFANDASFLNGQPASFYTNASNLSTGTVPSALLPVANTTVNGVVDTIAQSFAGIKTFTANVVISDHILGDGSGLTSLNASALATGTVPTARLGSGTANSSTFLAGDNTWQTVSGGGGTALPTGAVVMTFQTTPDSGYVFANGQWLSQSTYAALFALGGAYVVSSNATHFQVPDMRQRFPLGQAASGTGSTIGGTGGAIDHTHTYTGVVAHTHTITDPGHAHSITDPGHSHTDVIQIGLSGGQVGGGSGGDSGNRPSTTSSTTGISVQSHTTGISINSTGSASQTTASANPPFIAVNFEIKT